jgi:hypothetical protein
MRPVRAVQKEYKNVCEAMRKLERKGGRHNRGPLPDDDVLYMRLAAIKYTLEWVYPRLISRTAKGERLNELISRKHILMGPTFAHLHP